MGTTTKMAIPYPEATGLVKDGWEDMKDIATQVDAKSGLVLIKSATFSAVSSLSLDNNTFSANYLNYKILLNIDSSVSSAEFDMRLRAAGVDNSSANYVYVRYGTQVTTAVNSGTNSLLTYWKLTPISGTYNSIQTIDLFSPFDTTTTGYSSQGYYIDSVASNHAGMNSSGVTSVTTSYDSVTFLPSAGTITGTYAVYGYNK